MTSQANQVDLFLYLPKLSYVHVLSIPIEECTKFSLNPLKWLLYLGFVIYGSAGLLCTRDSKGQYQQVEYDHQQIEARQYYFRSDGPLRIVDVDAVDDRVTTSAATSHRERLKEELKQRDVTCIFTDFDAEYCEKFHILPHSKGDEYIRHVSKLRAGSDNAIHSIDDVRNSFLAFVALHPWWGKGGLAILKTPNCALKSDDIGYSSGDAPPEGKIRFILQHLSSTDPRLVDLAPHNSDARLPSQMNQWPPSFLTDMWYGCCAYNRWKSCDTVGMLQKISRELYYGSLEEGGDYDHRKHQRDSTDGERKEEDKHKNVSQTPEFRRSHRLKRKRVEEKGRKDNTTELSEGMMQAMDIILNLRMRMSAEEIEARRKREEEAEKKREEERRIHVQDWLGSVHTA